jgi:hypothetical protein
MRIGAAASDASGVSDPGIRPNEKGKPGESRGRKATGPEEASRATEKGSNTPMRKSFKIMTGLAVAGIAAAGGSAFTATGLATTGNASAAQFVGGTITQAVNGGTLNNIQYGYVADGTNTSVNTITLTFANALSDGQAVTAVATDGSNGVFDCEDVAATTTMVSTCSWTAGADGFTGSRSLSSLAVNVASSQ